MLIRYSVKYLTLTKDSVSNFFNPRQHYAFVEINQIKFAGYVFEN